MSHVDTWRKGISGPGQQEPSPESGLCVARSQTSQEVSVAEVICAQSEAFALLAERAAFDGVERQIHSFLLS